jgi:hypothetical protein
MEHCMMHDYKSSRSDWGIAFFDSDDTEAELPDVPVHSTTGESIFCKK